MQPSLENAYLRVKRAKEHIRTLKRMEKRLTVDPEAVTVEPQPIPPEFIPGPDGVIEGVITPHNAGALFNLLFGVPRIVPPLPVVSDRWGILFSETIHNLRAALDYLVYALAYLDSGQPQEGTQFPVCGSPAAFENLVNHPKRNPLRGVNARHIAAIEALQPYRKDGPDPRWLARLAGFSNADKHRHLTAVAAGAFTRTTWSFGAEGVPVQVQLEATYYVSFGDAQQTPVIPTLDSFVARASEALDGFKADFQRQVSGDS